MGIIELWLPIVLSAVLVFVASSILHMVLPFHKSDYAKLPDEEKVMEAMRSAGVQPGHYAFPLPASVKEMATPEMQAKYNQGPVGIATVLQNGPPSMGRNLGLWFAYCLLVGVFVAYIASIEVAAGVHYHHVFRFTGTIAILAYAVGNIPDSIWKGQSWSVTVKHMIDGVIYGLLTAGVFGWLWPDA